jgi:hypothetical protein
MDEAKGPESSSAASVLPSLSKSLFEALAARDYLTSVAGSALPGLSHSLVDGLRAREHLDSLAAWVLPSLPDALGARDHLSSLVTSVVPSPGVLDWVSKMSEPPVMPASLFTLPELEVASGLISSVSKMLEPPVMDASLFTLPELQLAPGLISSVSKMLEMPLMPTSLFTLPELELASGLISSVSKMLDTPLMPTSLFTLPELELASGLISSVSKMLDTPLMPTSLFTLPELQPALGLGPPLATDTPEDYGPLAGSGMNHLDESLWIALSPLPSTFREMHWGAWEALLSAGPDSRRQSAHSARELIDWMLRTLAPDHVFPAEHISREGYRGRPTRAMRVEWILQGHGREHRTRVVKQLQAVHDQLAAVAHTGRASVQYVRGLLRSTEGLLLALTSPPHA